MARRRPWPYTADEHRIAAISHARTIRTIVDDLDNLREYDRATIRMAIMRIQVLSADIERKLTLAKFGELEEE